MWKVVGYIEYYQFCQEQRNYRRKEWKYGLGQIKSYSEKDDIVGKKQHYTIYKYLVQAQEAPGKPSLAKLTELV